MQKVQVGGAKQDRDWLGRSLVCWVGQTPCSEPNLSKQAPAGCSSCRALQTHAPRPPTKTPPHACAALDVAPDSIQLRQALQDHTTSFYIFPLKEDPGPGPSSAFPVHGRWSLETHPLCWRVWQWPVARLEPKPCVPALSQVLGPGPAIEPKVERPAHAFPFRINSKSKHSIFSPSPFHCDTLTSPHAPSK